MDRQLIVFTASSLQKRASAPVAASAAVASASNRKATSTASAGGGASPSTWEKIKNAPAAVYQDVKKGLQPVLGGIDAAKDIYKTYEDASKLEKDKQAGIVDPHGPAFNPDSIRRMKTVSLMKDDVIGAGEYSRQEQARTSKPTLPDAVRASRPIQAAVNAGAEAFQANAGKGIAAATASGKAAAGTAATNYIMPRAKNLDEWVNGNNWATGKALWNAREAMRRSGFTDANLGSTPTANALSTFAGIPEVKAKLNKTDDYQIAGAAQDKTREVVRQQVSKYSPWLIGGGLLLGGLALGGAGLLGSSLLKKRKPAVAPATSPVYPDDMSPQQRYLAEQQAQGKYREFN